MWNFWSLEVGFRFWFTSLNSVHDNTDQVFQKWLKKDRCGKFWWDFDFDCDFFFNLDWTISYQFRKILFEMFLVKFFNFWVLFEFFFGWKNQCEIGLFEFYRYLEIKEHFRVKFWKFKFQQNWIFSQLML